MCLCVHFNEQHQSLFLKVTELGLSQKVTVAVLCAMKKGEESTESLYNFPSLIKPAICHDYLPWVCNCEQRGEGCWEPVHLLK